MRVSREERANTVLAGQWQWRIDCLFGQVGTRVQLERACLCLDSRVWRVGHELELQWATIDKSANVCVRHARTLITIYLNKTNKCQINAAQPQE